MRKTHVAALVLGAFVALPTFASASDNTAPAPIASSAASRPHMVKGVVRSIDDSKLVIERLPQSTERKMTFVVEPSTERQGMVRVGSTVDVRYQREADRRIATEVTVEHPKAAPSTSGAHQ
jgi:UPF0288 family protein (methanogenesis marker protein 3)